MSDLLVAKNIKFLMGIHGYSATSLQVASGITQSTTSRILKGETTNPRDRILKDYADFFNISMADLRYKDLSLDNANTFISGSNASAVINNGVNNGTQIGTQNLTQTLLADEVAGVPKESLNLKSLPLFDIDDGVKYALCDESKTQIVGRAKQSTIFIAEDSKAFGVFVMYELSWVMPTPIHAGEILVVEPCMPPRSGDLVLLCVGYPNEIRGMFARLHADINNKYNVQYDESKPVPMPTGSVICGVVRKTSRELIDGDIAKSRLNTDYNPLVTLVG